MPQPPAAQGCRESLRFWLLKARNPPPSPPQAQKASHFTQQHDVREEIKKQPPPPPPPSRLSADLFHVSDVLSHFRCCHYTQLGYFQWKYLRRNENSFGKKKYPELSLLCIATRWDLERVKRRAKGRACLCRKVPRSRTNQASQPCAAVPRLTPVLESVIWKPPAV